MKFLLGILLVLTTKLAYPQGEVPERAHQYIPLLKEQIQELLPNFPYPHYFGGLIEHESCITLRHSRCWSPTSRLKTHREEGAGLGQLTRAYNSDGSLRFDALAEAKRLDPRGLRELSWDTVYSRPDLQLRVIVLMVKRDWNTLGKLVNNDYARLAMTDAAYNGGLMGLLNERRACALKQGCDPHQWFGHVETTCLKSKRPLYGNRSACDINRHHVKDVLENRMPKYKELLALEERKRGFWQWLNGLLS
jgi:hypothetical protein